MGVKIDLFVGAGLTCIIDVEARAERRKSLTPCCPAYPLGKSVLLVWQMDLAVCFASSSGLCSLIAWPWGAGHPWEEACIGRSYCQLLGFGAGETLGFDLLPNGTDPRLMWQQLLRNSPKSGQRTRGSPFLLEADRRYEPHSRTS